MPATPGQTPAFRTAAPCLKALLPTLQLSEAFTAELGMTNTANAMARVELTSADDCASLRTCVEQEVASGGFARPVAEAVDMSLLVVEQVRVEAGTSGGRCGAIDVRIRGLRQAGLGSHVIGMMEQCGMEVLGISARHRNTWICLLVSARGTSEAAAQLQARIGCTAASTAAASSMPPCWEIEQKAELAGSPDDVGSQTRQLKKYETGEAYVGGYRRGRRSGWGVMCAQCSNKSDLPRYRYVGQWRDDVQHGVGTDQSPGSVFFGVFERGQRGARGVEFTWKQGVATVVAVVAGSKVPLDEALRQELQKRGDGRRDLGAACASLEKTEGHASLRAYAEDVLESRQSRVRQPSGCWSAKSDMPNGTSSSTATPCSASSEDSWPSCDPSPQTILSPSVSPTPAEPREHVLLPTLWHASELAAFCSLAGLAGIARLVRTDPCLLAHLDVSMLLGASVDPLDSSVAAERWVLRAALVQLMDIAAGISPCGSRKSPTAVHNTLQDADLRRLAVPRSEVVLDRRIGRGGYGQVFYAFARAKQSRLRLDCPAEAQVAIKVPQLGATCLRELVREARILAALEHTNVCSLLGVVGGDAGCDSLILELADGNLYDLIHRPQLVRGANPMDTRGKVLIAHGVARGLDHIHAFGLIHGDLKSPNVLIDVGWDGQVTPKICDFGGATMADGAGCARLRCGTLWWAAPESLRGEAFGQAADVYSTGAIIWEAFTGKMPHVGLSAGQVMVAVGWAAQRLDLHELDCCPAGVKEVAEDCLRFRPAERPCAAAVRSRLRRIVKAASVSALAELDGFME